MTASIHVIELTHSTRTLVVLLRNLVIGEGNDSHSHTGERRIVKAGAADGYHGRIRTTARAGIGYWTIEGYCSSIIVNGYRERIPAKRTCCGGRRRVWFIAVFEFLCESGYFCAPACPFSLCGHP